ncbi:hypothetical protein CL629_03110 [bacterium]|nr:hypothetical protein [bacterium]
MTILAEILEFFTGCLEFFTGCEEFKDFGINRKTFIVLSLATLIMLRIVSHGSQAHKIWTERSGEAVSTTWFLNLIFVRLGTMFYGIHANGFLTVLNGCTFPAAIINTWVLIKHRGVRIEGLLLGIYTISCASLIAVSQNEKAIETTFFFLNVGNLVSAATQPFLMWREKSRGVVQIKMVQVHILLSAAWTMYGFVVLKRTALGTTSLLFTAIFVIAHVLWCRYKKTA